MLNAITHTISNAADSLWLSAQILLLSAVFFCSLALLLRGDEAFAAFKRAARETRINLSLAAFDVVFMAPVLAVLAQAIDTFVKALGVGVAAGPVWQTVGMVPTALAAVFLGDFCSYWRHRLEHTRTLWPSHAIHHSDAEMTWLTLSRFHPINRITTSAIDITFLALLGLPPWALVLNEMVRHYYGEFIHADVPWTYGGFGRVLVSPAMHRWHHARDVTGAGSNFATVFSVFDQAFGTYYVPGPCDVPLGVNDNIRPTTLGQLVYPFVAWREELRSRFGRQHTTALAADHQVDS